MNKNIKLALISALTVAFTASADDTPNALVDSSGNATVGGFKQCIESRYNTVNADCGMPVVVVAPPKTIDFNITLDAKVLFDFDKSNLRAEGRRQLDDLARKIKKGQELGKIKRVTHIKVVGNTDSVGSDAYNQVLSEHRANSVRNYLINVGIPAAIIRALGDGENNPVASNATDDGRQKNRRVDVTVSGVGVRKE